SLPRGEVTRPRVALPFASSIEQEPLGRDQFSRGRCHFPRVTCSFARGRCSFPKRRDKLPRGGCSMPRGRCTVSRGSCTAPRRRCKVTRARCNSSRGRCTFPRGRCSMPRRRDCLARGRCSPPSGNGSAPRCSCRMPGRLASLTGLNVQVRFRRVLFFGRRADFSATPDAATGPATLPAFGGSHVRVGWISLAAGIGITLAAGGCEQLQKVRQDLSDSMAKLQNRVAQATGNSAFGT